MSLSSAYTRLASSTVRKPGVLTQATRQLTNATSINQSVRPEKRFVRIAGPASYASTDDMRLLLRENGVTIDQTSTSTPRDQIPLLVQGQADVYQNHSVWVYDAGSQDRAIDIASKITGKVAGMKLIRASPVDERIVSTMISPPTERRNSSQQRPTLRRRMNVIAPKPEEKGRALLATNLPVNMQPRFLWSFFAAYDLEDIRILRRSGVACVIFSSEKEAYRALRERSNLVIQNKSIISLKMHE